MKKILLGLLLVAACSKSSKTNHAGEKDHGKLTPELHAFHDVMAPRWHSDAGETRMKETCAEMSKFDERAAAIVAAPAPEGVMDAEWKTRGVSLQAAVGAMATTCQGSDVASFDATFGVAHDSFHKLMELVEHKN